MSTVVAQLEQEGSRETRVLLTHYRGCHLVDLRVFKALPPTKVMMTTREGVSLKVETLPALIAALQKAESQARALGLLS